MDKATKVVNGMFFEQVYPRPQSRETRVSHGVELQTVEGMYVGTYAGCEMWSFYDADGNPNTLLVGDVVREYPAPANYWMCVSDVRKELNWYPFTVSRIIQSDYQDDDGNWDADYVADSWVGQPVNKPEAKGLRRLSDFLYDYPDATSIWAGFVLAKSRSDAEQKIDNEV